MRKVIFAILVAASLCYDCKNNLYDRMVKVDKDSFGCISSNQSGKSFLQYFYSPENPSLYINGRYQSNNIVKLEGNDDFRLTTKLPKIEEELAYIGSQYHPKEIPFYFIELKNENQLAVLELREPFIRSVHFPAYVPLTFRVTVGDIESDFLLTLRGDDISAVDSVHLVTVTNDGTRNEVKLEASKDNAFTSSILTYKNNYTIFLEVKINKENKLPRKYENFLEANLHILDQKKIRTSIIQNEPRYYSVGEVFKQFTHISSYDDFIIEFPEDLVDVVKTTLGDAAPKDLITVVVGKGRIHVTFKGKYALDPEKRFYRSYGIEFEFFVKSLSKVTKPIVISRYNLEELKNTGGFIIRGNYNDDKVYFKASSESILHNNIYFTFKNAGPLNPEKHQIAIGYDEIPSDFSDFYSSKTTTQIVELQVDKHRARTSRVIIIALKRINNDSLLHKSTISCFEVKVTKDIYSTILLSGDTVNYSLKKGQSLYIINYGFNKLEKTEINSHSQEYLIENKQGEITSYAREIKTDYTNWKYTSLDSLFVFENEEYLPDYTEIRFYENKNTDNYPEDMGSIVKITAITDGVSGTLITGKDLLKSRYFENQSLFFLN